MAGDEREAFAYAPLTLTPRPDSSPRRAPIVRSRGLPGPHVLVRSDHPGGTYAGRVLRVHAARFLEALRQSGELSVLVATDREIRRLNREFRQTDKSTDVLSFEQDVSRGLLGDIVISLDTARRQAKEDKRLLTDELARLLAHGLLHLLGHDHETTAADARRMAAAEVELLGHVGLVGKAFGHPAKTVFTRARRAEPTPTPRTRRRPTKEN